MAKKPKKRRVRRKVKLRQSARIQKKDSVSKDVTKNTRQTTCRCCTNIQNKNKKKAMIHKARIWLIRLGKVLPFVICFIVMLSYSETVFNLATNDLFSWCGIVIPSKPISWFISGYFEYNLQTLAVLVIISIAIETCIYNKLACGYLGVNLWEKSYLNLNRHTSTLSAQQTYLYVGSFATKVLKY